ncbi:60S ribosomal protein L13a-2-like [Carica papaya]|uniref:60S ribosomal protein L13a-2-like n=1 Tax=Carica papaya TaxID=3649 RepID=UPI000B8C95D9|nr:60S ribosomal protein L13a-2-like [Carica papaya]
MVSGSGICAKRVVVDARHHMLGRLASILAKELLNGQKVVVVRCEEICMSGGLVRQKMKYMRFLRKRMNTKPSHGPIHFRSPAKIFWRTIRGFMQHIEFLVTMDVKEVSKQFSKDKCDLSDVMLDSFNLCLLHPLSHMQELEKKRKERSQIVYERKKQLTKLRLKAEKVAEEKLGSQLDVLAAVKY